MYDFDSILDNVENKTVFESLVKAKEMVAHHQNVSVSISGADSDVMLDIMTKVDTDNKCKYVWFDTGLEYQATKDHIKYLEDEYGIEITKTKPKTPIPIAVRNYGLPFLSKVVSQRIHSLQLNNFKWEDKPYKELITEYPKISSAIRWWCNCLSPEENGRFNISHNKYLKEFMIQNPPTFSISNKCCQKAKKEVAKNFNKENETDLNCIGVRVSEGGIRATAYKTCYESYDDKYDEFRPILWYTDSDRLYYENHFQVVHSKLYTEYGLKRSGCCCCPFGKDFEKELEIVQKYEPKLYKACMNIFGKSYEYTRKYKEFQKMMKEKGT